MTYSKISRVTHEQIQAGQARAYGPTTYEGILTFEWVHEDEVTPWDIPEAMAKQHLGARRGFKEKSEAEWWELRLNSLVKIAPGVWKYKLYQEYLD